MSYYNDVYKKRINRFGTDRQGRIQGKREKQFEDYLEKSVYRVDFKYNDEYHPAAFERYKQDETRTFQYLLTRVDLNMPAGTILMIPNKDYMEEPWMIYYLEVIEASGYNRYIMLKMTDKVTWEARDGKTYSSWAYLYGQENNMLKDELKSRSRNRVIYDENLKSSFLILPIQSKLRKDDYLEIGSGELKQCFRITGYDLISTEGVEYVTMDPVYEYDLTPAPEQTSESEETDFFWFNGGEK